MHDCNAHTWEVEVEESEVSVHPWLHGEFYTSLGYMILCVNKQTKEKQRQRMEGDKYQ